MKEGDENRRTCSNIVSHYGGELPPHPDINTTEEFGGVARQSRYAPDDYERLSLLVDKSDERTRIQNSRLAQVVVMTLLVVSHAMR